MRIAALLLMLSALACSEAATTPNTGQLSVVIDGLPTGVKSAVIVTGPGNFRQLLESSRTLSQLPSGAYAIEAQSVVVAGGGYAATPVSQTVTVGGGSAISASPIVYRLATARLAVTITGLPPTAPANITVSGPHGYSRSLSVATQIDLLEPGTYTISGSSVQTSGRTYRTVSAPQSIELLTSDTPVVANVDYGAGTGTLTVTISGLPATTEAAVTVTGPSGAAWRLTATTALGNLEAGTYTINASPVSASLGVYMPSAATQSVAVADGDSRSATVSYGSTSLQLDLLLVASGITEPVFLTAPDGDARLFIVEHAGRIRIVAGNALLATPFLDVSARVLNNDENDERGMMSMAFDPQYATNGFFYVYYVDLGGSMVVERFTSTPGSNVAGSSAGIVISIPHGGPDHHGGLITFGPDGMLYIAPGDGGCCGDPLNNAQNLNTLLGKILRIDVRTTPYKIPAGNPFVGQSGARPEIWAYGLRNPWRYSFDAPTGMLYIGDVGQDLHEEVDVVRAADAGLNFGWRLMEARACYNPATNCTVGQTLTLPVYDYPHPDGCSVIGGYVYRGAAIPELTGHYLFADFCNGLVRSFRMTGTLALEHATWPNLTTPGVVSFGRDGAGELYLVGDGRVWRIVRQ